MRVHHYPIQLRCQDENISALGELVQEVLERSSEEVARAIAEQASQRNGSILESLEIVQNCYRAIRSELEDRPQVLVAAKLRRAVDVSGRIGYEATVWIGCFRLRKAMGHRVGAVFCDFVDCPVFCNAALQRRSKQVSGRIDHQSALWKSAVRSARKRVQDRKLEIR